MEIERREILILTMNLNESVVRNIRMSQVEYKQMLATRYHTRNTIHHTAISRRLTAHTKETRETFASVPRSHRLQLSACRYN